MKKTEMLKKNYEFKKVLTKGNFFSNKILNIVVLRNNKNINYLGIAISKKNGKAFQRNRAKRLIREAYKTLEIKITCGNNIVILLNKKFSINNLNFKDVLSEMKELFEDANILKEEDVL